MSISRKSTKLVAEKSPQKKAATKSKVKAAVTNAVGNYEKHPFFIKKANAAKELLQKVGLPDGIKVKAS